MRKLEITVGPDILDCPQTRRALSDAFGLGQDEMAQAYRLNHTIKLLVTAEQFGMFVTLRHIYGGQNLIKTLEPTPITPALPTRKDCTDWRIAA